jgi:4-alpha-glucanotransferase
MPRSQSALRVLARRAGILDSYAEQGSESVRHTSDETRAALLDAMGFEARNDAEARDKLEEWDKRERERLLAPVRVVRGTSPRLEIHVRIPDDHRGPVGWNLSQQLPTGEEAERSGRSEPDEFGQLNLPLPVPVEPGYHRIRVRLHYGSRHPAGEQLLIVSPRTCPSPRERLKGRKVFGLSANLYAVKSERNWGVGDLTDLRAMIAWMSSVGGAFVGVNPLHALRNTASDVSPYRPVSRLYRNPLYLDVAAIPEFAALEHDAELRESVRALGTLREARRLDYDRVWSVKSAALERLYAVFRDQHLACNSMRAQAFTDYVRREGRLLDDHATFLTIEESLGTRRAPWWEWPPALRDARSRAVADFRAKNAERVDYHRWLQFEIDRQLAAADKAAQAAGMAVGLYQDLAIGCAPDGSDAWANQGLLLHDVHLGAPPDQYSENGQNWGLPPMNPHVLREQRFEYWIALVRSALRHGGALRMDHILGLFRQFWIPAGRSGRDGAYVQFPTEEMLGILALEAHASNAIIVGEDLGTVPPEVPPTLRDWEILGTKVMYFERQDWTGFAPAAGYEEMALTVADTHDQVPIAGFWLGRDIDIRREVGLLTPEAAERARADRELERAGLTKRLQEEGLLSKSEKPDPEDVPRLVNAFLCKTPSLMVALSLEDIVAETEPVNVPGVTHEAYPSWTRRLTTSLERITADPVMSDRIAACTDRMT